MRTHKHLKFSKRSPPLDAGSWIRAGRRMLMAHGIGRVKVLLLAEQLHVSTGSFYWHFSGLPALQAALLTDWEANSTAPLVNAVNAHPESGVKQFEAIMEVWVDEDEYSPVWDAAIREWARSSSEVNCAVRRIDAARIELLQGTFKKMGYGKLDALVRARITYYHQVGYYALKITESKTDRLRVKPRFDAVLMGTAPGLLKGPSPTTRAPR